MQDLEKLKYPIGKFYFSPNFSNTDLLECIASIEQFPKKLREAVHQLSESQLNTPYRPDGWTVKQLVHHCADSHMNSLIRLKMALTEDSPTIKPYAEAEWAKLVDSELPLDVSLNLIDGIHLKWSVLLKNMSSQDFERTFIHPEKGRVLSMNEATAMYAWHCNHHLAHITKLAERENW